MVVGAKLCLTHSTAGCSLRSFKNTYAAGIAGKPDSGIPIPFEPLHKVMNRGDLSAAEAHFRHAAHPARRGHDAAPGRVPRRAPRQRRNRRRARRFRPAPCAPAACASTHGITARARAGRRGHRRRSSQHDQRFHLRFLRCRRRRRCAWPSMATRSISSRCGSADVLEALGARVDLAPERVAACIRELGIGFLFAPLLHPQ